MGLDTYVLKVKDTANWNTSENFENAAHWRKCWGVDSKLALCGFDGMPDLDEYVRVLDVDKVRELYNRACARADKIVSACNRYKAFPYDNVMDIWDLEALDIDFDTDEMYQLFHTIEDIAGNTFSNSIWGSISTVRMTIDQLGKLLDGIEPDDILIWVSSF